MIAAGTMRSPYVFASERDAPLSVAGYQRMVARAGCKSASNLDPTPIVHQVVEAEAKLLISGVFDRRPTVTPSFLSKIV
jgi:hypothetical protein